MLLYNTTRGAMPHELTFFPKRVAGQPGYADRIREAFRERLEKSGLRLTHQRLLILDHLLRSDRHVELEQIYRALRRHGIGRATVFRTIKLLEESRLADHVTSPRGLSRYEVQLDRPHHDHLICIECGTIEEVRWPELEDIQDRTCRQKGFTPTWHRHEIFGRCRRCGSKPRRPSR